MPSTLVVSQQLSLVSAAIFTGAAIYINTAAHLRVRP